MTCVGTPGVDGQDCFPVPAPSLDQGAQIESSLRHRLAGAAQLFWRDSGGCIPWAIRPGPEQSVVLSRAVGTGRQAYTLRPSGPAVTLEGPVDSDRTTSRAVGCLRALDVGAITDEFVEVGGARWFFDEAACRADTRALFSPPCSP
jgi:hypothetical protein